MLLFCAADSTAAAADTYPAAAKITLGGGVDDCTRRAGEGGVDEVKRRDDPGEAGIEDIDRSGDDDDDDDDDKEEEECCVLRCVWE